MASQSVHERELRDPTREELYTTGPKRELPVEIQQMAVEDTACTFCGVSYFVFAEVQELQATVKKYKKTFHEFVRFLERERKISQDLKAEIQSLKKSFAQVSDVFATNATQLAAECTQLRLGKNESTTRLFTAQRELTQQQDATQQLQSQLKRAEEEWKIASSLTEQKLQDEILHLSSQIEKCKLQSSTQETEFAAEFEREKVKIRELEARYIESQESWSSSERLVVTERDQLKQKLLSMTERVELEQNAAKQLEAQLKTVQQELSRIASSNDAERATFSHLNSEVIMFKHQLHRFEKNKALLLAERAQFQEEKAKSDEKITQLRLQVGTLHKKIEENALTTEKFKQDYVEELEKLRIEHANDLNRLQRDHGKVIEELKMTQKAYIEFLKKETSEIQQGLESTKHTSQNLEKQHVRRTGIQAKALADTMEKKILALEGQKTELEKENSSFQRELDQQKSNSKMQMDKLQEEVTQHQQCLEAQNIALQRRIDTLQAQVNHMEDDRKSQQSVMTAAMPQVAWGGEEIRRDPRSGKSAHSGTAHGKKGSSQAGGSNNQESHDFEKVVEKLRLTLDQKDREISLLQQTVHRECLERTSLLEKMRSGKILPDMVGITSASISGDSSWRGSGKVAGTERVATSITDEDESNRELAEQSGVSQLKASFYEKLRKAGQRKSKPRK